MHGDALDVTMAQTHDFVLACMQEDAMQVHAFIESGVDINLKEVMGLTGLMVASSYGVIRVCKDLLHYGADLSVKHEVSGWTALMYAAEGDHDEVLLLLLERGATLNETSAVGSTALMLAAAEGHASTVLHLLQAGADVYQKDHNGQCVLTMARTNTKESNIEALIQSFLARASARHALTEVSIGMGVRRR